VSTSACGCFGQAAPLCRRCQDAQQALLRTLTDEVIRLGRRLSVLEGNRESHLHLVSTTCPGCGRRFAHLNSDHPRTCSRCRGAEGVPA